MGEAVSRPFHKRKTEAPRKDPRASQSQLYGAPEDGANSSFISDGICSQEGAEPGGRGGARLNSFLPSLKPGGAPSRFLGNLAAWRASSLCLRLFFCSRGSRQTSDSAQDRLHVKCREGEQRGGIFSPWSSKTQIFRALILSQNHTEQPCLLQEVTSFSIDVGPDLLWKLCVRWS